MKLRADTYKRGAIYSASLSVVVKFIAFIQNLLIAYYLGAVTGTDIYFYLFGGIITGCEIIQTIVSSVLIPRSMQLRNQLSAHEENSYINAFLYSISCIIVPIIIVIMATGEASIRLLSNFSENDIHEHIQLLYILLPVSLPYVFNIVYTEILTSHRYFIFPQLIAVINNLSIVFIVILFHEKWNTNSSAIGFSIATLINSIWLLIFMKRNLSWNYTCFSFVYLKGSLGNIGTVFANHSVVAFTTMFPLYLLSMFYPGTITVVTYAIKLLQAPMNLLLQLFTVLQIKLNEQYSLYALKEMRQTFMHIAGKAVLYSVIGAIFFFLLRTPVIEIFFGRGAMTSENTSLFIHILGILIISIPFSIIISVSSRMLYALQRVKVYSMIMMPTNLLTCAMYYWLILSGSANGYAYTVVLTEILKAAIITICTFYLLKKIK